jgi:hypothetical protein
MENLEEIIMSDKEDKEIKEKAKEIIYDNIIGDKENDDGNKKDNDKENDKDNENDKEEKK